MRLSTLAAAALTALAAALAGCAAVPPASQAPAQAHHEQRAKNVIFFLGDGMGLNTLTAARIFHAGEEGELTIDEVLEQLDDWQARQRDAEPLD